MKVIRKDHIIQNNCIESTLLEKKIMQTTKHPFLCQMKYFFQTEERLYFVMPYIGGGNLYQLMQREGQQLTEQAIRFYAIQIITAVGELHEGLGVMHRDLKLENLMLDPANGYLKLIDFGLATESD